VKAGGSLSWLDSVGINRRGVVNERVTQERSSDHPDPSHARAVARLQLKRWTGAYVGWVLSSENGNPGADGVSQYGRQQSGAR